MPTLKNYVFHQNDPSKLPPVFAAVDELAALKLRVPVAFKIRQLRRDLATRYQDFGEIKNNAIKRLGVEKDGGISVEPGTPEWEQFQSEYRDLVEQPFEVDTALTLDDLDGVEVSADTLEHLGDLLDLA